MRNSPSHDGWQQQENIGGRGQRAACSVGQWQADSGGNREGKSRSGSRRELCYVNYLITFVPPAKLHVL